LACQPDGNWISYKPEGDLYFLALFIFKDCGFNVGLGNNVLVAAAFNGDTATLRQPGQQHKTAANLRQIAADAFELTSSKSTFGMDDRPISQYNVPLSALRRRRHRTLARWVWILFRRDAVGDSIIIDAAKCEGDT